MLKNRFQTVQKCLDARRTRVEQRSILYMYVSSENRSATQQMNVFQQYEIRVTSCMSLCMNQIIIYQEELNYVSN
jgi:hypothetical protein